MEEIKFSGKYSLDDYKKSLILHAKLPQWLEIIRKIIDIAFLTLFAIVSIYILLIGYWVGIPLFVLIIAVLIIRFWYPPRRIQKVFHQEKFFQSPFEIEITDEHFLFSNEIIQAKRAWKDYVKWRENQDFILLYPSDAGFQIIPKRFFNDENDDKTIKRLLRENGIQIYQGPIRSALIFSALFLFLFLLMLDTSLNLFQNMNCWPASKICQILSTAVFW